MARNFAISSLDNGGAACWAIFIFFLRPQSLPTAAIAERYAELRRITHFENESESW